MGHILRLVQGHDPRNPTKQLTLSRFATASAAGIALQTGGFAAGSGDLDIIWSGRTSRRDGQDRVTSSYDNAELKLMYNIKGNSMAHCARLNDQILQFAPLVRAWEEDKEGDGPVYLVYMWGEDATSQLANLPAPQVGQFCHYIRIKDLQVKSWPKSIHDEINTRWAIGVEMNLVCAPLGESLPEYAWIGEGGLSHTVYGLTTSAGDLYKVLTDELTGSTYTISGWATLVSVGTQTVFQYQVSGSDHLKLDYTGSAWRVTRAVSATYTISHSLAMSAEQMVHFVIINNGTNLIFMVNGAQVGSNAIGSALPADGTFFLGKSDSSESGMALDGWRIWEDTALTTAQGAAIYTAELALKQNALVDTENLSLVGMPPVWLTPSSNGAVTNPGYGQLLGVNGSAPALVEWRITSESGVHTKKIWLGRKASLSQFNPTGNFIFTDADLSAATGASGSGSLAASSNISLRSKLRGRLRHLVQLHNVSGTLEINTAYHFVGATFYNVSSDKIVPVSISTNRALYDLGDINFNWPSRLTNPDSDFSAEYTVLTGTPDLDLDYSVLLPFPTCTAEHEDSVGSGATNIVVIGAHNNEAWMENVGTNDLIYYYQRQGQITAEPNQYNYIIVLVGLEGSAIAAGNVWTIQPVVTQRWLLPGGMIA